MINHLQIQNFKCWKDTGNITLSPLTVFFGSNSSGKSSIGQFLMMLKQSVEFSDRKTVFYTGNDVTAVELGLPANMIYNQDPQNHIVFSYDWIPDDGLYIGDNPRSKKTVSHIKFSGEVKILQSLEVESIKYDLKTNRNDSVSFALKRKSISNSFKKGYQLQTTNYKLTRNPGRAWDITSPVRFYGFPDEAVAYYKNAGFLQNINLVHERLFSTIHYLGPLRNRAKRLYTWLGGTFKDVGVIGEDSISAILAAREEKRLINLKDKSPRKSLDYIVAKMLKKMGLIEDFKINQISESRQDYEVKVKTRGSKNYVDIPDVGVGVSQVLPVIVELFCAPPGSTIIIEQPELHLHPSAQAHLADVMIDAIHAKEDYASRNIQLIIESHSEHFLRRLQRRVAEDTLKQDELSAYFIDYDGGAHLKPLQLDIFGEITNWPENFFGEIEGDIYYQAKAGVKKRLEAKNGKENH